MNKFALAALHSATAGLFALTSLAGAADAPAPHGTVLQLAVHYGDLDLTHETDAHVLYGRIHTAARRVCPDSEAPPIERNRIRKAQRECVRIAVNKAIADVNSPLLTALNEGHGNVRVAIAKH